MIKKRIFSGLFLLLTSLQLNAQMFRHNNIVKENKVAYKIDNYQEEITFAINEGYLQLNKNISHLVQWELKQYVRILKEIEQETKNLPPYRKNKIKTQKVIELAHLLSLEEVELDFQHIELIDHLNEINKKWNKLIIFRPKFQIEGRLQDKAIEVGLYSISQEKYHDKLHSRFSIGIDIADMSAGVAGYSVGAAVSTGACPQIAIGVAISFLINSSVDYLLDELLPDLEEIVQMRSDDFVDGLLVDEKKTFLELIR